MSSLGIPPEVVKALSASFITPLLAVFIGLIADPIQRRGGKGSLEFLEKRINLGKQLLDLGNAHSLDPKETARVKRELELLYRQYLVSTRERALQAKRDRSIQYQSIYKIIPPRPRTALGGFYILAGLYGLSAFAFTSGAIVWYSLLTPDGFGFAILSLFALLFFFGIGSRWFMFLAAGEAQKYVIDKRRKRVPSLPSKSRSELVFDAYFAAFLPAAFRRSKGFKRWRAWAYPRLRQAGVIR